jgi:predicted RNA-binding protein YlqC (UPF0109 family)
MYALKKGDEAMKDLIKCIAQALVDDPDQVEVFEIKGNQSLIIELKVAKKDMGKIIGRAGLHEPLGS